MPPDRNPAKPRVLSVGQRVFDRFYLKRKLGDGGTGIVWLAHDRVLEQEVAPKFLADHLVNDRKAVERLKHETRRNLKLSHPNIVRIHDFLQDANGCAITMEYVEGWSLWTMKVDKPNQIFSIPEITPWLRELFAALDYAHHQAGIVHRDIKPGNLMINARGQLKITDFGLARNIRKSTSRDFVDRRVVGTDVYMSPQQWSGHEPTISDDIYSIGATLYELLTGKPPFYQGNILDQVYETVPPSMKERLQQLGVEEVEIPEAYEKIVAACLSKHPEERPGSVSLVAAGLGLVETTLPPAEAALPETPVTGIQFESEPEPAAPAETPEFPQVESMVEESSRPAREAAAPRFNGLQGVAIGFALAGLVGLLAWGLLGKSSQQSPSAKAGAFPEAGMAWENSLGMKFVPVPEVPGLLCVWETRLQDFKAYVADLGREPGNQMLSMDNTGSWKETGHNWIRPEFEQHDSHPVVGVSWREAMAFCDWLTTRERAAGRLTTNQSYRLPTLAEWFKAAGTNRFVWGDAWPPAAKAGNFAGEEIRPRLPAHSFLAGYNDGYSGTAPVGSFNPNGLGIYDLSGNVSEFCADRDEQDRTKRRWLVGGSWQDASDHELDLKKNTSHIREVRRVSDCGFRLLLEFRGSSTNRFD
ncbi:MAG: bifunctional serine/threonine-protein kinase/formylglycine-generating enzyme family protein [Verrucomicrobiota bacterium]